ncbi:antibiotic biosynthesis monooxygenase [Bradyrhizobium sp. U87765 SZCCT0131]|jgi:quinol monooxygenase YgiN|uniref:putative quinol monooxygenase n=2 Tax=Bradyrhizobium TaxID=374 RepID=UPI001BA71F86|nr:MULTISPECIES: putative quinol monooxygenase [unclassified Bradyrhizobium]MBR1218475.1 antibiotic biosynthesis monooxygenase [Bradyrhizobium sp. U87765 SZCCT0131]MBR1260579.1 antibiotic biosynthesis monooxygenase [Bradyrhizobium sp. U87765 SZCCT0134]MBR1303973.1 antibiotic biosynthesis monooxygenase [Bradyrhizobium sp. U87765 SZCCT0110]MBR1319579.1 antibiotic biosynthesis monooxygenase [Bradyrhizobium sp. U87765 SZCCT0109]MBR1347904.1 antibiotic biosynthesis monooxygenase [Bradyrhizobium sp.
MIMVTGTVLAEEETFDEVVALSLAHVQRSRGEPGCLAHAVHIDCENPLRLVFVEQWEDQDALAAHFQKAESRAFVRALRDLLAEPAAIEIYRAEPLQMG